MNTKAKNPKPGLPEIDELLCFSIYSAGHAFNQLYRPMLDEIGLTYPQYLVLVALWSRDGRTVKELGKLLYLDSSTLTPLLKRMESAGLITRTRNMQDERQVLLHLTNEGRAFQARAAHVSQCVQEAVGLDAETVRKVQMAIDAIRDGIHKRG
ncbi:MarR family transcriptional regulator [Phyllobacterium salinisoli]|uniref:MarR family transcriptional regulator n=1 Tax=Phyllobacterium salinisoli TaxID=1899321 RepID=A0A368K3I1_9HYPH|nr:MarR family transcriptional regulator [Phyllobacterium salinisoli]RCS22550.1 MarR family transcriptional regulator [Phyllobacterium salinisoli]